MSQYFSSPAELESVFLERIRSVEGATGPLRFVFIASVTCTHECLGNVNSSIAVVQSRHLCKNACNGLVNCRVRFWNGTTSKQGATGPPRFVNTPRGAYTSTGLRLYMQRVYENAVCAIVLPMGW